MERVASMSAYLPLVCSEEAIGTFLTAATLLVNIIYRIF